MSAAVPENQEAELSRLRGETAAYQQAGRQLRQTIDRSVERSTLLFKQAEGVEDARVLRHLDDANRWRQRAIDSELEVLRLKTLLEQQRIGHAAMLAAIEAARTDADTTKETS